MSRLPYSRAERMAEAIRKELGMYFIQGLVKDSRIDETLVTVTHVKMTDDLKEARVFLRKIGADHLTDSELEALNERSYMIKKQISKRLELRYTPAMTFEEDKQLLEGERIFKLIEEVSRGGGTHA